MMKSKQIKNTNIKALKYSNAENSDVLAPWEKKIQAIADLLNRIAVKVLPKFIFYKIDFLDDLEMFKPKDALEFLVDRWVRILTLRQFRYRLGSAIDYFRRGYNSYDFDSFHALDDFIWKLERLAVVLEAGNIHYGDSQNALQIRKTIELLNRVQEDDYLPEFEAKVSEKYGDSIMYVASTKGVFGCMNKGKGPFKNKHTGCVTHSIRENWTPELDKEIWKAEGSMYRKASKKRLQEWKKALEIIELHFFEWWN